MREDTLRRQTFVHHFRMVSIPARMREDTVGSFVSRSSNHWVSIPARMREDTLHLQHSQGVKRRFNPRTHARRYSKYAQEIPMQNICYLYNKPKIKICQPLNLKNLSQTAKSCAFSFCEPHEKLFFITSLFLQYPYDSACNAGCEPPAHFSELFWLKNRIVYSPQSIVSVTPNKRRQDKGRDRK